MIKVHMVIVYPIFSVIYIIKIALVFQKCLQTHLMYVIDKEFISI